MTEVKVNFSENNNGGEFAHIVCTFFMDGCECEAKIDNHNFKDFFKYTGESSSTAFDFYVLATVVYNIDKLLVRNIVSSDGWTREIKFDFPVHDVILWNQEKNNLEHILNFLTGDIWHVSFKITDIQIYFNPESSSFDENTFEPEVISLFSGGLDSLIGAITLLESQKKVLLVSHYDGDLHGPKHDQKALFDRLQEYSNYGINVERVCNRVGIQKNSSIIKFEKTFRSRSLLFLGMAAYLAHNITPNQPLILPENGSISINFPLSKSRRSSCSTRTTHPYLVSRINDLFQNLGIKTCIMNPFELKTKGEMLIPFQDNSFVTDLISKSCSCAKPGHKRWWGNRYVSHCGKCMPCVYRRAAINKINKDLGHEYGDDIFNINLNHLTEGRYEDIRTLLAFISSNKNIEEIKRELLVNGSIDLHRIDEYAGLVLRTVQEIKDWILSNESGSFYLAIKQKAGL